MGGGPPADSDKTVVTIRQLPRPLEPEQAKKATPTENAPTAKEADELVDEEID